MEKEKKLKLVHPRCMIGQVENSGVIDLLKDSGFISVDYKKFQDTYEYSLEDWASLITWPMGAGSGKLDESLQKYIEKSLIKRLKVSSIDTIDEVYEHFIFSGFKQ